MGWTFGQLLVVVLAVLLGLAAGWVLRGRRDAAATGSARSIVEGDPVTGVTGTTAPAATATVDAERPEATVDATPAPAAVTDEPAPADLDAPPAAATLAARNADADATDTDTDDATATPPTGEVAPLDAASAPDHAQVDAAPTAEVEPERADVERADQVAPVAAAEPETAETVANAPVTPAEVDAEQPTAAQPAIPAQRAAIDNTADVDAEPAAADRDDVASSDAAPVAVTAPLVETTSPVATPAPETAPVAADAGTADDFRRIQGVGPKMASALQAAGIRTYAQLAELDEAALRETIRVAGLRAASSLATWSQQAKVLAGASAEAERVLPAPAGAGEES